MYGSTAENDEAYGGGGDTRQILNAQRVAIQDQDAQLDALASGLMNVRRQAETISNEAEEHTKLLGDIEDITDDNEVNLAKAQKNAETARTKSGGVFRLQIAIIVLFVILLGLIFLNFSKLFG